MNRLLKACLILIASITVVSSGVASESDTLTQSFFASHCVDCHDPDSREGGLDLTSLIVSEEAKDFGTWVKILDKVYRNEMPPSGETQPESTLRSGFLTALSAILHQIDSARQNSHGRVVLRRLNRTEYTNTVHDLLGVDTPLREMLPEDTTEHGFDNVGEALNLSVAHLERYLYAADLVLSEATVSSLEPETTTIRTDFEETWHDYNHGFQNSQWVNAADGNLAIVSGGGSIAHGTLRAWSPPVPNARYRFRVRARAMMQRRESGKKVLAHDRRIIARAGIASQFKDGLATDEVFYELSPDRYREFIYEARVPEGQTFSIAPHRIIPEEEDERAMVQGMCVVVDWIEIEGPLTESSESTSQWPPRGHRLLYGGLPLKLDTRSGVSSRNQDAIYRVHSENPHSDARRLIKRFLPLVFRRPVSESEVEAHFDLFREQMDKGIAFDHALRAAYKMALTSPQFLFLQEAPGPLTDHALAARLSYGLWGSLPDEELTQLANAGKFATPETLQLQTDRMLRSHRAGRFHRQFLNSWLNLRDIDFTQPDLKLYPEFDSYLQASMVAESIGFFREMLDQNLSVSNVVDSDFLILNDRLAEHYGLLDAFRSARESTGLSASEPFPPEHERLIKVPNPQRSNRGGFITQGAVLKVSANGTVTSPIVRGAYFLERILGTPPDPPPSNVAAVEPDIRGTTTIREQLHKHRDQSACALCHAKIDPPGFALENYDVTGRWRTHYRIIPENAADKVVKNAGSDVRHYIDGLPVEPHYTLADGRSFQDIKEFKELMRNDTRQLARCMVEKLTTYLTGAPPQFADRIVIEQILDQAEPHGYGLRDLVHGVIQSSIFQTK